MELIKAAGGFDPSAKYWTMAGLAPRRLPLPARPRNIPPRGGYQAWIRCHRPRAPPGWTEKKAELEPLIPFIKRRILDFGPRPPPATFRQRPARGSHTSGGSYRDTLHSGPTQSTCPIPFRPALLLLYFDLFGVYHHRSSQALPKYPVRGLDDDVLAKPKIRSLVVCALRCHDRATLISLRWFPDHQHFSYRKFPPVLCLNSAFTCSSG